MLTMINALAEPKRFEIVEYLRSGSRSVNEIAEQLNMRQPQASKHLRVLNEAGIVERSIRAQSRIYELRAKPFQELGGWVETFKALWGGRLNRLDDLMQELQANRKDTDPR